MLFVILYLLSDNVKEDSSTVYLNNWIINVIKEHKQNVYIAAMKQTLGDKKNYNNYIMKLFKSGYCLGNWSRDIVKIKGVDSYCLLGRFSIWDISEFHLKLHSWRCF